jgi:hypothetical protein
MEGNAPAAQAVVAGIVFLFAGCGVPRVVDPVIRQLRYRILI